MSKATSTPTTSRRRLLAGSAAGSLAAAFGLSAAAAPAFIPATSPDHPDAPVIAACMRFMEVQQVVETMSEDIQDPEFHALLDRWHDALEVVIETRAKTLVGLKAKARVMIVTFEGDVPDGTDQTVEDCAASHEMIAWRLAHDILLGTPA